MRRAYRIVREKFAATAFTGEGAALTGGRWNSPGTHVVYTSATASLAALETLRQRSDDADDLDILALPRLRQLIGQPLLRHPTRPDKAKQRA